MEKTRSHVMTAMLDGAKRIHMGLGVALAMMFLRVNATAQEVDLGTANNFEVLSAAGITSTGNTVINGNIGTSPITGAAITGFPPAIVNGTIYTVNSAGPAGSVMNPGLLTTAMGAVTTAYNQAAGLTHSAVDYTTLGSGTGNLGGQTLTPGVYTFSSIASITGTLTLNDEGLTDPVFVFQIGSSLTTASGSSVVEENTAPGNIDGTSIFWEVGSSATLGTGTAFDGNILANTSITLDSGATDLDGRLLAGAVAPTGAVTLDDNTLTAPPAENVPDKGSTLLLLGSGLAALFVFARRFSSPAYQKLPV
jgi:hypothetical protein